MPAPLPATAELRLTNDLDAMAGLPDWVERFATDRRLPPDVIHDLHVVLDELVNNAISYGYDAGARGEIVVRLRHAPDHLAVEVEDDGRPFDPLQAPPPDLTSPLAERQVGGLGVHIVKNLMDEVAYARVGGKNVLKLLRNLAR